MDSSKNLIAGLALAILFLVATNVRAETTLTPLNTLNLDWAAYFGPSAVSPTLIATENAEGTGVDFTFSWDEWNGKIHNNNLYFWSTGVFSSDSFDSAGNANYMTGGDVRYAPTYAVGGAGDGTNRSSFEFTFTLNYDDGNTWDCFVDSLENNEFQIGAHFQPTRGNSSGMFTTGIGGDYGGSSTATPEPATLLILGLGAAGAGGYAYARRRWKKGQPVEEVVEEEK